MVGVAMLCIYIVYYPLSFVAPEFVQWLLLDNSEVFVPLVTPNAVIKNFLTVVLILLLAPVVEEIIFRGFLFGRWHAKYGATTAILGSSVLFSLLHMDILGTFIFSIFLCFIRVKYNSLLAPMLVHLGNNVVAVVLSAIYMIIFGGESGYSIEEFRTDWWLAPVGAAIGVPWLYWYFKVQLNR